MSLDIHSAVQVTLLILLFLIVLMIWQGITSIKNARRLPFFRLRRNRTLRGWRLLGGSILLIILAIFLNSRLEPMIYTVFPPTATITLTPTITTSPTITQTPTITLSPTVTLTPAESYTPTITPTPFVPLAVEARFEAKVTPNPDAVFSDLVFTQGIDALYQPVAAGTEFQNPVGHLYAVFSYDQMVDGSQWTALWFRNGELVYFETRVWDGGTGGFGYTDWNPDPSEWLPGQYEVQIFNGLIWKRSGRFTVQGEPPTPAPTLTPSISPTPTRTLTPTRTPSPTRTATLPPALRPTRTPYLSPTITPSRTPYPTLTRTPVTPTRTLPPTRTPLPTRTRYPTLTPSLTFTLRPTFTFTISPTVTLTRTPYQSPTYTLSPTPYPTLTRTPVTPSITPQQTRTRTPTPGG